MDVMYLRWHPSTRTCAHTHTHDTKGQAHKGTNHTHTQSASAHTKTRATKRRLSALSTEVRPHNAPPVTTHAHTYTGHGASRAGTRPQTGVAHAGRGLTWYSSFMTCATLLEFSEILWRAARSWMPTDVTPMGHWARGERGGARRHTRTRTPRQKSRVTLNGRGVCKQAGRWPYSLLPPHTHAHTLQAAHRRVPDGQLNVLVAGVRVLALLAELHDAVDMLKNVLVHLLRIEGGAERHAGGRDPPKKTNTNAHARAHTSKPPAHRHTGTQAHKVRHTQRPRARLRHWATQALKPHSTSE
jgi:hypothetical protein